MRHYLKNIGRALFNAFVKLLENVLSKKFLVFIICTALLIYDFLPAEYYAGIALSVLGVQSALDWQTGSASLHPRDHDESDFPPEIN